MAIRRSQMNSLLPPARRERDGLLSDIFQVSLQDEEQIVAGQPRGPLRWARDGELGQATPGGHLNEPSLSLRLFLKHPFGSARFSLTTLPDPPCSAPAPTPVLHDGHQESQSDCPEPRSPPGVPPTSDSQSSLLFLWQKKRLFIIFTLPLLFTFSAECDDRVWGLWLWAFLVSP